MNDDDLTRLQRILVGTDGTVTHILETYAGEPIEVLKIAQGYDTAVAADGPLDLPPNAEVLRRRVVLRGARSRQVLLYAEAVVVPGRVGPTVITGLIGTDKPIGTLLAESRAETYREILAVGREPAGTSASVLGIDARQPVIWRTYRIFIGRSPSMLITERLPAHLLRDLPS